MTKIDKFKEKLSKNILHFSYISYIMKKSYKKRKFMLTFVCSLGIIKMYLGKIKKIKTSTAATVGNMACGGVKSNEAGKISCEVYQGETK